MSEVSFGGEAGSLPFILASVCIEGDSVTNGLSQEGSNKGASAELSKNAPLFVVSLFWFGF